MALAQIFDKVSGKFSKLYGSDYPISKIINPVYTAVVKHTGYLSDKIRSSSYPVTSVTDHSPKTQVSEVLPFRVRFTNVGIQGYGPGNPAPIGIAVIGLNNYIL